MKKGVSQQKTVPQSRSSNMNGPISDVDVRIVRRTIKCDQRRRACVEKLRLRLTTD
jgi:hypothetical protein